MARRAPRGRDVPGSSSVRLGQHFVMPGVNEFTLLDRSPAYSRRARSSSNRVVASRMIAAMPIIRPASSLNGTMVSGHRQECWQSQDC